MGVAVLFVAALFVLTLAEVWPGRSRWAPLLVGLALAGGALAVTVAVEPATALLIAGIVAVAAVALVIALVALERREREAARVVEAGGAPPEPETEGGSARFRGTVALTLAAATLLGASVGYLQGQAGDAGAAATHAAQDQALLALAEHQRTMGWAQAQVEVWTSVEEARARAIGARQLATYLAEAGDPDGAAVATAAAERHDANAAAADELTVLSDDHPDGPRADPAFPSRFLLTQQAAKAARVARQDLANEANAAWGAQVAAYVAVLATIAIAAYLLGLSLVLRTRRLRALFAVTGLGLVLAAAVAAGMTALAPSSIPSATQQAAIAAAYARATLLDEAAATHEEHVAAVAAWREVVALHPTLARAHVELASELFSEGSPQTVGYSSIATLEATAAALAELETAAALGWDDLSTRGDTGFYRFLVGLREPASGASAQAVLDARSALELSPELPVLRYNVASALLADGRLDEARTAFADAIAAVNARDETGAPRFADGERIDVSSGAITDLELIAAARADQSDVQAAIAEVRLAVVNGMGDPVPAAAADSPAAVSGLGLYASPSELWWQARIDGFDATRDVLTVLWLHEDPAVPGWQVLSRHSGPLRLGDATIAGGFYENGAAPDYYASQGYLMASNPATCVPDGRYRVELYLNGRLAADPVEETLDMPELVTERRTALGVLFCRPAGWTETASEPGRSLAFADETGTPRLRIDRVFRPDPDGDAGRAEIARVMDAVATDWDPTAVAIAAETTDAYLMALSSAQVQWYQGADGWLKVFGGATSFGTVITVAVAGTSDWVDGQESSDLVGSFYLS